jgi:hypothetical protein
LGRTSLVVPRSGAGTLPIVIYRASGARTKGRRSSEIPRIFLYLLRSFSLSLSLVSDPFLLTYKR